MIDLHCHILPGVDDGSRSIEESIAILKSAKMAGFDTICFTPHYAEPMYLNNKKQNYEILQQVETKVKEEELPIQLLLGNEVFITGNMEELLKNGEISTLADTKYLLIELPMYQELAKEVVQTMLDKVREQGYKVVIAHPERYTYVQENPEKLIEYFGENVIFQGNYGSIIGSYGKNAQKTIKELLENKEIHYLSSDTHHVDRCFYEKFDKIKKKLLKVIEEEYFDCLSEKNPRLVIENGALIEPKQQNWD